MATNFATDGDDQLFARTDGADTLRGQAGNDTLTGFIYNDLLEGQLGRDMLQGMEGNDVLRGGWDGDTLIGGMGDDLLEGGWGDDWLDGNEGVDTLRGGEGNDTLLANQGLDTLDGGAGNDSLIAEVGAAGITLIGGDGDDTLTDRAGAIVLIGRDSGHDLLMLEQNDTTLRFAPGIRPQDVAISFQMDLMTVRVLVGNTELRIATYRGQLARIEFDNGAEPPFTWSPDSIRLAATMGTSGDDHMDLVWPGVAAHGGDGRDTLIGMMPGQLLGEAGDDTLKMYMGIMGTLDGGDGRDWLEGGWGDDTLIGGAGDDTLHGGQGRDTYRFNRGDGHDVIMDDDLFAPGDAWAVNNGLMVELGWGLDRGNTQLWRDGLDLVLSFGPIDPHTIGEQATADELRISGYFNQPLTQPVVRWGDGSQLWPSDIAQLATPVDHHDGTITALPDGGGEFSAGWGQVTVVGGAGDDVIDASHVSGLLIGNAGHETYRWGLGSGDVVIEQGSPTNTLYEPTDTVQVGMGITPEMLRVSLVGGEWGPQGPVSMPDVRITIDGHSPTLTLRGSSNGAPLNNMPTLAFADGRLWGSGELWNALITQDPSLATWVRGGPDTIDSGQGPDGTGWGGGGADTYVVGLHNNLREIVPTGTDYLDDPANRWLPHAMGNWGDVDVLQFTDGIRPQDVLVEHDPNAAMGHPGNIVLRVRDTDRRIVLRDFTQLAGTGDSEVDEVHFADGTVWTLDDLRMLAWNIRPDGLNLRGGLGDDTIAGEDGNDWIEAGAGQDLLDGGAGNDTMAGGLGDDLYIVDRVGDEVIEQADQGEDAVWSSVNYTLTDNVETLVLTGNDSLVGQGRFAFASSLVGNAGANVLVGGRDSDTLSGMGGADTLVGGDGTDFYFDYDNDAIIEQASDKGMDVVMAMGATTALSQNVEALFMMVPKAVNGIGNEQGNWMYASQWAANFDGRGGNDHLFGGDGADTLVGGAGNDELVGGLGNDLYIHSQGDGFDTLLDQDKTVGNSDQLDWRGVNISQLWLSQSGGDLKVQVLGSTEGVLIRNWFSDPSSRVERMTAGGRTLSSDRVAALVQVMSTMTPPPSLSSLPPAQQSQLTQALNQAWQ